MKAKEFIAMGDVDRISVRDKVTGKWLKDPKDYNDREVDSYYAKCHKFGNPGIMRAEVVVFVR